MPSETCTEIEEKTQEGAPLLWAGGRGDLGALQVLNSYTKSLGRDGPQLLALGQFYRRQSLFSQARAPFLSGSGTCGPSACGGG